MAEENSNNQNERDAEKEDNLKTESQYSEQETSKTTEQEDKGGEQGSQNAEEKTADQEKAEKAVKDAEDSGATAEELERTRKALAKANKEAQERRHKLAEWDDLGVDPETVRQWKEERRNEEIRKAEEEGRYQDIIERTRQEAAEEREKAQSQVETMKNTLERYLVDRNLTEAIAAEDGVPKLLEGIARQSVKTVQDESGEYRTVVVDQDGMPRKNESGEDMSIRELVQSFKQDPDLQYAFKAPKTSGSGNDSQASSTPPSKKPGPKPKKSEMTQKQQREFVKEHGYAEFAKLPR